MEQVDVIIIGAGQAGLALSHELVLAGVEHVVLERKRIGWAWQQRWDSFCLVTPNWTVQLPGFPYEGADPDGFMPRDEIVDHLQRYARSFAAPVREDTAVASLRTTATNGFILETTSGPLSARLVVVATGAYQRPHRIGGADALPADILQIDAPAYHHPGALPEGKVLVIGSGQSGAQIAEELCEAGRDVWLACGRAAWLPRRLADRDIVWWLREAGFFDQPAGALPSPRDRLLANPLASGHRNGHDLHLRTLRALGVTLAGHFLGAAGRLAHFADDLAESVVWGDARYAQLMDAFRTVARTQDMEPLEIADPEPFDPRAPERLELTGFGAIIFAGGFRPDYSSLLPWPEALDESGFPVQRDGASTVVPGLFFLGTPFLRTRKSPLLLGVGEDAAVLAAQILARPRRQAGRAGLAG